jgi:Ydr279p protein family (RNase H2 complex component) wHTH domain/Ydr279p protein triple barrel domain
MAPRTRSTTNSPVKKSSSAVIADPTTSSSSSGDGTPIPELKVFLLPSGLSTDARFVFLPHPRDGSKKRFLFCPSKGLFEFTKIAAPSSEYRSILLSNDAASAEPAPIESDSTEQHTGYISKEAQILAATQFDVFFLLLSLLPSSLRQSNKVLFQPLDDLLEVQMSEDRHLKHVFQVGRRFLEDRLASFSDTVDAGDEKMFRISEEKVIEVLTQKITRMVQTRLPASLEERFVTRALDTPVLSIKREESSSSTTLGQSSSFREDTEFQCETLESQSTAVSAAPSVVVSEASFASSASTLVPDPLLEAMKNLQRLKVAANFVLASYVSPALTESIWSSLNRTNALADFEPLEKHLQHLAALRAEAAASRSLSDFSRKRGNADDDEGAEEKAEKKRRLEEDEKRKKAGESRGVRDLKKVNVTGMRKMSDFFGKKTTALKVKA